MSRYIYVDWPESQEYMDKEGFEENAILDVNTSGAYFIQEDWLKKVDSEMSSANANVDPNICYGRDDLLAVAESIANEVGEPNIAEDLCEHMAKAGAEFLKYLNAGGTYTYTRI